MINSANTSIILLIIQYYCKKEIYYNINSAIIQYIVIKPRFFIQIHIFENYTFRNHYTSDASYIFSCATLYFEISYECIKIHNPNIMQTPRISKTVYKTFKVLCFLEHLVH